MVGKKERKSKLGEWNSSYRKWYKGSRDIQFRSQSRVDVCTVTVINIDTNVRIL